MPDTFRVPGVYARPRPRVKALPRTRTDIAGFVGVAGPRRLGELLRIDDYRTYEGYFLRDERGNAVPPPPGSRLAECVKAFFLNGGARCWVVNVAAEIDGTPDGAEALLQRILGVDQIDPPRVRFGLELLLSKEEVALVALPELDATVETVSSRSEALPPSFEHARFFDCARAHRNARADLPPVRVTTKRVYADDQVLWAQRYLISRVQRLRWRCFAILAPPAGFTPDRVDRWRERLTRNLDKCDPAALYWPWLLVQESERVVARSPLGYVTGAFARRDLALGPHWPPASEPVEGVVGLEYVLDDEINGRLYDAGVNVLRSFPGRGVRIWGARSLLWASPEDSRREPLAYVSGRRCLSAIERTVEQLGQAAVFEPNRPLLRLQVAQAIAGYLMEVFNGGALHGTRAEDAFFVRCNSATNPGDAVARGELLCEVGVALAVPAEFVVFRLHTTDGGNEISEVS
jgi:uncharacterized protein